MSEAFADPIPDMGGTQRSAQNAGKLASLHHPLNSTNKCVHSLDADSIENGRDTLRCNSTWLHLQDTPNQDRLLSDSLGAENSRSSAEVPTTTTDPCLSSSTEDSTDQCHSDSDAGRLVIDTDQDEQHDGSASGTICHAPEEPTAKGPSSRRKTTDRGGVTLRRSPRIQQSKSSVQGIFQKAIARKNLKKRRRVLKRRAVGSRLLVVDLGAKCLADCDTAGPSVDTAKLPAKNPCSLAKCAQTESMKSKHMDSPGELHLVAESTEQNHVKRTRGRPKKVPLPDHNYVKVSGSSEEGAVSPDRPPTQFVKSSTGKILKVKWPSPRKSSRLRGKDSMAESIAKGKSVDSESHRNDTDSTSSGQSLAPATDTDCRSPLRSSARLTKKNSSNGLTQVDSKGSKPSCQKTKVGKAQKVGEENGGERKKKPENVAGVIQGKKKTTSHPNAKKKKLLESPEPAAVVCKSGGNQEKSGEPKEPAMANKRKGGAMPYGKAKKARAVGHPGNLEEDARAIEAYLLSNTVIPSPRDDGCDFYDALQELRKQSLLNDAHCVDAAESQTKKRKRLKKLPMRNERDSVSKLADSIGEKVTKERSKKLPASSRNPGAKIPDSTEGELTDVCSKREQSVSSQEVATEEICPKKTELPNKRALVQLIYHYHV